MDQDGIAGLYPRSRGGCPVCARTRQVVRTQQALKCGFCLLSLVSMRIDVKDATAFKRLWLWSRANRYCLRCFPAIRVGYIERAFVFSIRLQVQDASCKIGRASCRERVLISQV